ncbi:mitochondrial 39-S ribosomal protein L47 (MRP-L47)-domain-containing protein, partial [Cladochytrium replicatum]
GLAEFFDHDHGWDWGGDKAQFGRAWKCAELRLKSFDDLHKLWWVCLKERNRLFSQQGEAKRFQFMFPKKAHLNEIRKTMRRIKLVVWERKIAYFQAKEIYEKEVLRTQLWEQGIKDPVVIDATVLEKFP